MKKTNPAFFIFKLFLLFFVLLFSSCTADTDEPVTLTNEEQPVAVEAIRVMKQRLIENIQGVGLISGVNEAYIISETRGIIREVSFELGDYVKKGVVLVKVESELANLNMEQARQQWETAKVELNAIQKLFEKGNESTTRLNQVKSAEISARARYEQARKAYEDCFLKTPISGYIAEKDQGITIGNYLNNGSQVARIVDLSALKMNVAIGEGQIGYIREGAPVTIRVPATCEDVTFDGKVAAIAAGSDLLTGSFTVLITWENTCKRGVLKSGMTGSASIAVDNISKKIVIPVYSIRTLDEKQIVYVEENGIARKREIQPGKQLGQRIEILKGLNEGEILIISGFFQFSDGNRVETTIIGEG